MDLKIGDFDTNYVQFVYAEKIILKWHFKKNLQHFSYIVCNVVKIAVK
jgi:hypothetical protein